MNEIKEDIKFLYRFLVHLGLFLIVSAPLIVLGILILFPIVYFYDIGALPKSLRWFDSADPFLNRDISVITRINRGGWLDKPEGTYSGIQGIINKYIWLALRNPINYFSYQILGFILKSPVITLGFYQTKQQEIGDGANPGLFYTEIVVNDKIYYEYYWIYQYGASDKCFRFRMGYKIGQDSPPQQGIVEQVFVISPYHLFTGKNNDPI